MAAKLTTTSHDHDEESAPLTASPNNKRDRQIRWCWRRLPIAISLLFIMVTICMIRFLVWTGRPMDWSIDHLAPDDRYLSYSEFGRLSNNLISLSNAIYYGKMSGRKILAYPLHSGSGHADFNLSWLQILDLNQLNSYFTQNQCHIKGLGTDPIIDDYIMNGVNRDPTQGEAVSDAPWCLRRPEAWSSDCWILPWSHTPIVAATIDVVPCLRSPHDVLDPTRFPGSSRDPDRSLSGLTYVDAPDLMTGLEERADDKLVLVQGEPMYWAIVHPEVYLSYNANIKNLARAEARVLARPSLCMHVRCEDLSLVPIDSFINAAQDLHRNGMIKSVFVITNGNEADIDYMRERVPGLAQVGCDPDQTEACRWSPVMRAAIEQQICAETDYFIGSHRSTFSQRIQTMRARESSFPTNSSWILHQ